MMSRNTRICFCASVSSGRAGANGRTVELLNKGNHAHRVKKLHFGMEPQKRSDCTFDEQMDLDLQVDDMELRGTYTTFS